MKVFVMEAIQTRSSSAGGGEAASRASRFPYPLNHARRCPTVTVATSPGSAWVRVAFSSSWSTLSTASTQRLSAMIVASSAQDGSGSRGHGS
eukprot:COSAG04_NODE_1422_length_6834_cov_13.536154_4_plen_92_part_00